jgi:hypothetical protein
MGPGCWATERAASTSAQRAPGWAWLGDPPAARRSWAGLVDARVKAEVGDQLAGGFEAADVADRGQEDRRADDVDARHGHQPLDLRALKRFACDQPLDLLDLCVEELDVAQAGLDRLLLLFGQLKGPQPHTPLDAEQVGRWRAALGLAHEHGVDLVLDARAGADELLAAG